MIYESGISSSPGDYLCVLRRRNWYYYAQQTLLPLSLPTRLMAHLSPRLAYPVWLLAALWSQLACFSLLGRAQPSILWPSPVRVIFLG